MSDNPEPLREVIARHGLSASKALGQNFILDLQLLARYVRQRSEDAFGEVVRRYVDLVHSAALRQVRSPELAEEVIPVAAAGPVGSGRHQEGGRDMETDFVQVAGAAPFTHVEGGGNSADEPWIVLSNGLGLLGVSAPERM